MGDGVYNLDFGGEHDSDRNGSICVALRTSVTPAQSCDQENSEANRISPNNEDGDLLPTLEIDEYVESEPQIEPNASFAPDRDSPDEAITPPGPSAAPETRLSDFRCGGSPIEYPAPNGLAPDGSYTTVLGAFAKYPSSCGGSDDVMKTKFEIGCVIARAISILTHRLQELMDGLGRFCSVRGISAWLTPGAPGWGEPSLDYLIWTSKVRGRKAPTLKGRFAAIRCVRLVSGNLDFAVHAHRAKALIKGLEMLEVVQRKQPFNTDLLRWVRREIICKSAARNTGAESMHYELYTACISGFFRPRPSNFRY